MKLPDKLYDCLKWLCIIGLPALATLWYALGKIWAWNNVPVNEIEATIIAIDTFLGAILGISTIQYQKGITANGGEK